MAEVGSLAAVLLNFNLIPPYLQQACIHAFLRRSDFVSNAIEGFGYDTGVQPTPELKQEPGSSFPQLPERNFVIKYIALSTKHYPGLFASRDSNLLVLIKRKTDSKNGREGAGRS